MLLLRFAAVLAAAVWIGGLLAIGGVAAPAIFDVTALRNVPDGRALAGAIAGETFRRFHLVSYGCGAVIFLTLVARAVLGPRPRRFAIRAAIAAVMLSATLYSGIVVSGAISRLQASLGPGVTASSLPESDPRRAEFGRLHGQSTMIQLIPLIGGLVLIFWELRD